MLRTAALPVLLCSTALLAACGSGNSEDNKTTETRMDNIDSVEGTISDDAINTDQSTEEGMIDPDAPAAPKTGDKPKAESKNGDEPKQSPGETAPPTDAVNMPAPATDKVK